MTDPSSAPEVSILHIIPEDGTGGVEIAAKTILSRPDLSCRCELLFILNPTGELRARHVKGISNLSWGSLSAYVHAFRRLRRSRTDVLIFSLWKSVPLLVLARLFLRRRRIVYFLHLEIDSHLLDAIFSRIAIRLADAVWADSEVALVSRGVPATKRQTVISFVTEQLVPRRATALDPTFVSWGRLHQQKGVDRAITLIAFLAERGIFATLHAYGRDDGAKDALIAQAIRMGVGDRIHFPGVITPGNRANAASSASFFLQLSRFEGMCMAAVEGMQLGLVPVATPVGQMRRYVEPGRTGILVDPDDLGAAADELVALLNDPDRYSALSLGARAYWSQAPLYADDVCRAATSLKTGDQPPVYSRKD